MNVLRYLAALLVMINVGMCQNPDKSILKIGYTNDLLASMDPCG